MTNKKETIKKDFKIAGIILRLVLLLAIIVGLPLYIYFYHYEFISNMSSLENVKAFFEEYKTVSVFVYILAQIIQIIICIIPGQWLQIASGFMHGFWLGLAYSIIGAFIGTVVTYYLAKWLGRDAMHLIFGEEKISHFMDRLNSKKAVMIVFLIFLIPGIPKDLCNYAAGLSDMKLRPFLIVSLIGRTPGMMGSILIGRQLATGSYIGAIIISTIAVILFILGIIFRKKVMAWFDLGYKKLMKNNVQS